MKKIIQVKNGEYLLEVRNNAVATTYNRDIAMDVSDWEWSQLEFIVSNLVNVGYGKTKVLEVRDSKKTEKSDKEKDGKENKSDE